MLFIFFVLHLPAVCPALTLTPARALCSDRGRVTKKYNLYLIQHTNKSLTIFGWPADWAPARALTSSACKMKFMKTAAKNYGVRSGSTELELAVVARNSNTRIPFGLFMVMLIRCWVRLVHCCWPTLSHPHSHHHHHHHWFSICHSLLDVN